MMSLGARLLLIMTLTTTLFGCQSYRMHPISTVESVDLERFMGRWFVIASIPTFLEKDIANAIEEYRLVDGKVDTRFTFRKGGVDGKEKSMNPVGEVRPDSGNAVWDMQFVWPFKAEYRIIYLSPDYETTVIGRSKRDYAWIMARNPSISETELNELTRLLEQQGYDLSDLRTVPQHWPAGWGES